MRILLALCLGILACTTYAQFDKPAEKYQNTPAGRAAKIQVPDTTVTTTIRGTDTTTVITIQRNDPGHGVRKNLERLVILQGISTALVLASFVSILIVL